MPLLNIKISDNVEILSKELIPELSSIVSEITGKPEDIIMTVFTQDKVFMGNSTISGGFVEYRYIGNMDADIKDKFCTEVCRVLRQHFQFEDKNIYFNFISAQKADWGTGKGLL